MAKLLEGCQECQRLGETCPPCDETDQDERDGIVLDEELSAEERSGEYGCDWGLVYH